MYQQGLSDDRPLSSSKLLIKQSIQMGCMSSRSTVAPTTDSTNNNGTYITDYSRGGSEGASRTVIPVDIGTKVSGSLHNMDEMEEEEEVEERKSLAELSNSLSKRLPESELIKKEEDLEQQQRPVEEEKQLALVGGDEEKEKEREKEAARESSMDEEDKLEFYKQYVAIDFEITHLEDRDTLRIYHEKIEQLEQLERELDLIDSEVEEVAASGDNEPHQMERVQSPGNQENLAGSENNNELANGESNSIMSEGSSWENSKNQQGSLQTGNENGKAAAKGNVAKGKELVPNNRTSSLSRKNTYRAQSNNNLLGYSTVEDVFNRKIILEKERDRLKKEVESIIVECDRLQKRYTRRDEILDKLFDGQAGNGLENHLEQQLNWLMEQKTYVDQVFYAWKRAETLTSQTCEQFASALELLKRLPSVPDGEERQELVKTIAQLLLKSRQDMEQAQKYNPNVEAPFFTENETERFDKIIETISAYPISPSKYSQIMTVIQFAYKRSVSIRLWLEQILQTTIARDSFELAEEYKWIAIQLRKERISIVKMKLQEQPLASIAQSIREELTRQQYALDRRRQQEVNRDSGVESEVNEGEIEEEIYRLLELNKARLQVTSATEQEGSRASSLDQRDQMMRNRIDNRIRESHERAIQEKSSGGKNGQEANLSGSKLRIELDEEAKRQLLEQVGEMHNKHKSRIEVLRGSSKAKASHFIRNRRMARQQMAGERAQEEAPAS